MAVGDKISKAKRKQDKLKETKPVPAGAKGGAVGTNKTDDVTPSLRTIFKK